jgi:ABC-type glycerol-3-phosphate transport system substrate-binding protein
MFPITSASSLPRTLAIVDTPKDENDPLKLIGRILRIARDLKKHTQAEAATHILETANKTNVSNIEEGRVALPWRAIPRFAEYTGTSAAGILALLAAAKTWRALADEPAARLRLEREFRALLRIPANEPLGIISSANAGQHAQDRQPLATPFTFWESLCANLPEEALPRLAPINGNYEELRWDEALLDTNRRLVVLQGSSISGVELLVSRALATTRDEVAFVDVSAADGTQANPKYVRKELSISAHAGAEPVVVYHRLPNDLTERQRFKSELRDSTSERTPYRVIVLDEYGDDWDSDGPSVMVPVPIPEQAAVQVINRCLTAAGVPTLEMTEWLLLAARNPFWLAMACRLISETRRLPSRWSLVRAGVHAITTGAYHVGVSSRGLYALIREQTGARLRELATASVRGFPSTTEDGQYNVTFPANGSDDPRYLHRIDENIVTFVIHSGHVYFAALHFLIALQDRTASMRAIVGQIAKLAGGDPSDRAESVAVDIAVALLSEAKLHSEPLFRELWKTFNSGEGSRRRLALRILASAAEEGILPGNVRRESGDSWKFHRRAVEQSTLYVLLENQATGQALRRLIDEDAPRLQAGQRGMTIEPVLMSYTGIRKQIELIVRAKGGSRAPKRGLGTGNEWPSFGIIACPHQSLFRYLAEEGHAVPLPSETQNKLNLGSSILARLSCRYDNRWMGVPFQYPTKYFAYRRALFPQGPPSRWDELKRSLQQITATPRRGVRAAIALQGQPGHPALYYEWLSVVLALGGGDVTWRPSALSPEVIIDSPRTKWATKEFLSLFTDEYSHPKRLQTNWENVLALMSSKEVALCAPFSDTVAELLSKVEGEDVVFAPFRLGRQSYVARRLFSYAAAPVHVFTGHVFAVLPTDERTEDRAFKFLEWFFERGVQQRFMNNVLQSPLLDRLDFETTDRTANQATTSALRAGSVAEEYPFLPVHSNFDRNSTTPLPDYQQSVLSALSTLVPDAHSLTEREIDDALDSTARHLRESIRSSGPSGSPH